jgi:hypothetical protein
MSVPLSAQAAGAGNSGSARIHRRHLEFGVARLAIASQDPAGALRVDVRGSAGADDLAQSGLRAT